MAPSVLEKGMGRRGGHPAPQCPRKQKQRKRGESRPALPPRSRPKSREQPECLAWALQKEQRQHLGQGSRRWCRAALGETRQDDEGLPAWLQGPRAGSLRVRPPRERVASLGPLPTRSRLYSLAGGDVRVQQEAGRNTEALYLLSAPPHPGTYPVTHLGPRQISVVGAGPDRRACSAT